jgi:tyrosine aminotransferase
MVAYDLLRKVNGLEPIKPSGAMYMMVGIKLKNFPKMASCLEFMIALANEQSVFIFPGNCFNFHGYFRIVITSSEEELTEACVRIKEFCDKHYKA